MDTNMDLNDKTHRSNLQAMMGRTVSSPNQISEERPLQGKKKLPKNNPGYPPVTKVATEQKAPKPHERVMEFQYENKDYNVAEFYEHFQNDLPKTVIVNQGFCGEIVEDTFDREQVFRVHAISRQSRVTAKFQYGSYSMFISIPMTYQEKFCLVKHGNKRGKPEPIDKIVRENKLPVTVQFPKDHQILVGSQTVSTNNIPNVELMQTFEEVYLLANNITDGVMSEEVIHVPLYLSKLRLAVVTGIKGQPTEKWSDYQQELDRAAAYIEFDQEFGNPNIAEYDPIAIHHTDTTYPYLEPRAYSNITSLVHKPQHSFDHVLYPNENKNNPDEGQDVYEEIDNTVRVAYVAADNKSNKQTGKTIKEKLANALPRSGSPKASAFYKQHPEVPPVVVPKHLNTYTINETDKTGLQPPPIPERRAVPPLPKPESSAAARAQVVYSNDLPRSIITPMTHIGKHIEANSTTKKEEIILGEVNSPDDVAKLTVEEVVQYLEKLKLGQYANLFKDQLIDGAILQALDRDIIKEDFGMKGIEALRLMKFAKEGYIPK